MNVIKNITFVPINILKLDPAEQTQKAIKFMQDFKIQDLANLSVRTISGGQKQRVAIIRSLMLNPEIMILDEPTSALDPHTTSQVIEAIDILAQKGVATLCVTHHMSFVKKAFEDVIILNDGKLMCHCAIKHLDRQNQAVQNYIENCEI